METQVNNLIKSMVETIEAAKASTAAPAPEVKAAPAPKIGRNEPCNCGSGAKFKKCHGAATAPELQFEFMDARDKVGLPMEHASYVRRNCTDCNGRGFIRLVVGARNERVPRACFCVNKGYVRTRKEFESQWKALLKNDQAAPHSEAEEWAARVNLVMRMGFTAPPIPTEAEPAPQDV